MNPIITGLVGYGGSGKYFHAPFIALHHGFILKYIVERTKKQSAELYPEVESISDFDWLISDETVELVVIATPNSTHFALCLKALKAGKSVIVEKPFTSNTMEAIELIKIAREKNLFLGVYQSRRFEGDFLTIQRIIKEGILGELVEFESHFDRYRPGFNVKAWKEIKTSGTGLIFDLGSHLIDQALVLFGLPISVTAIVKALRPKSNVDDYFYIRLEYSGLEVILRASQYVKKPGPRFALQGRNGSFLKFGIDPQEAMLMKGKRPETDAWAPDPESHWGNLSTFMNGMDFEGKIPTITASYMQFYRDVFSSLRENKPFSVPPTQAYHTIRIIELALESSLQKRTLPYSFEESFRYSFG